MKQWLKPMALLACAAMVLAFAACQKPETPAGGQITESTAETASGLDAGNTTDATQTDAATGETQASESTSQQLSSNKNASNANTSATASTRASTNAGTTKATTKATTRASTKAATKATTAAPQASQSAATQMILKQCNQERQKEGVAPLQYGPESLQKAADIRAKEAATQSFSHTRPNGSKWSSIYKDYGLTYSFAAENLAKGQPPELVVAQWMNSPDHRLNILNPDHTQVAIGIYKGADGGYTYSQLFYTP